MLFKRYMNSKKEKCFFAVKTGKIGTVCKAANTFMPWGKEAKKNKKKSA